MIALYIVLGGCWYTTSLRSLQGSSPYPRPLTKQEDILGFRCALAGRMPREMDQPRR